MKTKILALDIETECAQGCDVDCDHALDPWKSKVTVAAISDGDQLNLIYRDLNNLWSDLGGLAKDGYVFCGHNLKFDIQTLAVQFKKLGYPVERSSDLIPWGDDTLLMATALLQKIPEAWLLAYEERRAELNKLGGKHRKAAHHSLKTLAPYFLGVEAFWESTDHNNDEYVLKDAGYTAKLRDTLETLLIAEGTHTFYKHNLLPYTQLLCDMEWHGVEIDNELLGVLEKEAAVKADELARALDEVWAPAYDEHYNVQKKALWIAYGTMRHAAIDKRGAKANVAAIQTRYGELYKKALAKVNPKINLDSPAQLAWLLKDHLKLDITDYNGKESTGASVLQKLAATGRGDISLFLDYRENQKLATAFFPSYRTMQSDGALHGTFNAHMTRTGRLSSSRPNLQQVPGHLHRLFKARKGHSLITKDMSAIEPRLIAYYSEDLVLYDILKTGQDFHGYNTKIFFGLDCDVSEVKRLYPAERALGKETGLALMYGAGYKRLQECAQKHGFMWGKQECREKVNKFKDEYEGVYQFRNQLNNLLLEGPMPNLLGRQFAIPDPENIHMQGLNTLIQSSASDYVVDKARSAQLRYRAMGLNANVVLLVHDEIVVEAEDEAVEEAAHILEQEMTGTKLSVPYGTIDLLVEGKVAKVWEK